MNMSIILRRTRTAIHRRSSSLPEGEAYLGWIRQYLFFNNGRHPALMDRDNVFRFIDHLRENGKMTPAAQNQALGALDFLYTDVLQHG